MQIEIPVDFICKEFALGQPQSAPQILYGGLIHNMWHIRTTTGEFAIKKINQANTQLLVNTLLPIHHAESLAQQCQQRGISARAARQTPSDSWSIYCAAGQQWMVFPWISGHTKSNTHIQTLDAMRIGELLIDLHAHQFNIENLRLPAWFGFEDAHWQTLIHQAQIKNLAWAELAHTKKSVLKYWSEHAHQTKAMFTENMIISHRDISMSNIIWNKNDHPVLIDWEYAGLINPMVEIYITAMTWSLTGPGQINETHFDTMVAATGHDFKINHPELVASYAGYLLEWCEFNMQRSLFDENFQKIASCEVANVINILALLDNGRGDRN